MSRPNVQHAVAKVDCDRRKAGATFLERRTRSCGSSSQTNLAGEAQG